MKTCSTVSSGTLRFRAQYPRWSPLRASLRVDEAGRWLAVSARLATLLIAAVLGVPSAWAANSDELARTASSSATAAAPVISVWYGLTQTVHYDAQDDFNLLGEVDNPASTTMQVRVNGGTWRAISVGNGTFGDSRRLGKSGDWNADIPMTALVNGANPVDVSATNNAGTTVVTVTVNKQVTAAPPEVVNWSSVTNPQEVGQYVDGKWTIGAQGLETVETGYDRLFMLGDRTWQDYEILVPITIRRLDDVGGRSGEGPGIGFIMRWQGHIVSDNDPEWQPKYAFERMGGITWLYWFDGKENDPYEYFWGGGNNSRGGFDVRNVTLGETYWMRARVVSLPEKNGRNRAEYSWKMWQDGTPEPADWDFVRTHGHADMLTAGGPVLVAHHVDASFGDVVVTMLQSSNDTTPPVISNVQLTDLQSDAATVSWDTDESASGRVEYGLDTAYGQQVGDAVLKTIHEVTLSDLTPQTIYHYRVVATDAAGNSSASADQTFTTPASTNTAPTASMALSPQTGEAPLAVSFDGSGSTDAEGPISGYAWDFGDGATGSGATVSHTYQSAGMYTATLTVTDGAGATAQATATVDVTAPPLTAALESDDFSGGFDAALWTTVDPVGDGTVTTNGTQLELSVPASTAHDAWGSNRSLRIMQSISDVSFEVEAKFESVPTQKYQLQGLLVEEGPGNYMRFDFYSDGLSLHVFAASTTNGSSSALRDVVISTPTESTLWMRVRREGSLWRQYYSTDGTTWTLAAEVSRSMVVAAAGVFAGNAGSSPAFTAVVDYVFDTAAPIEPEDDGSTDMTPPTISDVVATAGETAASISWTTDEAATSRVEYGTTTDYGSEVESATLTTSHALGLSGLTASTTYHYRVVSTDIAGNTATGGDRTFMTAMPDNQAPTAAVTATPTSGTAPLAVAFDASASTDADGTITGYAWDFGDGATGTGVAPSHTYQASGSYTATVTVTDDGGATAEASVGITATGEPAALVSDDFSGGFDASLWTTINPVGDGTLTATGTTLNLALPAGSDHDVWSAGNRSLRVMQSISGTDFEAEVKFESVPTAKYQIQGLIVEEAPGEFLRFDVYSTGSGINAFAADFAGGNPTVKHNGGLVGTPSGALWMRVARVGDTWTYSYSVDGSAWTQATQFSRALTVTQVGPFAGNASGSSSPAFTAVVDYFFDTAAPIDPEDGTAEPINQAPTAAVTATPTSGTAPLAVAFDASASTDADGTITGYAWDFGDGATGTGVAPSHTYQASGSYTATVTVTDDGGATAEASVGITATGEPAALVSDDFSGGFDASLWTINDPAGDGTVSVNSGVLEVAVPSGSTHDLWSSNTDAVRVMQAASNGDLEVEVAFTSVVSQRYQIQGLLFEEGPGEMLRFDFYSDGRKVKIFAAGFQGGSPSALINKTISVTGSPLHMRVQRLGDTWTQSWSNDGSTWTVAGQFDWVLTLNQAGVFAGNSGSDPAHTAQIDAFTVLPPSPARTVASTDPLQKEAQSDVASGPALEVAPLAARQAQGEVILEWDSYLPVQSFELQHSAAGADFRTVRRFESEGTEGKAFQHVMPRVDPGTHEFRLVQTHTGGEVDIGEAFSVHVELFEPFLLQGVYPNPSSERAAIKLMTAEEEHVRIEVYNVLGQRVEILHDGPVTPQEFRTIAIPTDRLVSGTYFLRVRGDSFHETRRMAVVH